MELCGHGEIYALASSGSPGVKFPLVWVWGGALIYTSCSGSSRSRSGPPKSPQLRYHALYKLRMASPED